MGGPFSGSGPPCEISVVWSGLLSCPTARPSTRALSESSWEAKNRGISAGQGLCLPLGFPGNAGLWPAFSPPQLSGRAGVQLRVPTWAPVRSVTTSPPAPSAPGPGWQLGRDTVWDQAGAGGGALSRCHRDPHSGPGQLTHLTLPWGLALWPVQARGGGYLACSHPVADSPAWWDGTSWEVPEAQGPWASPLQ